MIEEGPHSKILKTFHEASELGPGVQKFVYGDSLLSR